MNTYLHRQIYEELLKAKHPVFISDRRIDGDSLGATLAMVDLMKSQGVKVPVYISEALPEQYQGLPHSEHCTEDKTIFNHPDLDLVVVFDCSEAEFVQELLEDSITSPKVINIDHHATNSRYGHINQVIVDSPATAEVVYKFYQVNNLMPSKEAATCMLTGIFYDTTALSNSATNDRALEAASDLILCGARIQDVIKAMFNNRSVAALKIWGKALERLRVHPEFGFVTTCILREDLDKNGVTDEELGGLSNFLNYVVDTDTVFVMHETKDGGIKVGMRSFTQNVALIAKAMGGGGHVKAAGFTVPNSRLVCNNGTWSVVPYS
ncbi:bifunctional oligoribonuclease/PAP phosphatase NrnA [Patescibacteria group bacterium]